MKKFTSSILLLGVLLTCSVSSGAATLIAGWDFQTITTGGTACLAVPNAPTVYAANFGSGNIYMDGTNGSSSWVTATTGNELTAFSGTATNAGAGFATTTTSPACLGILGGTATAANGKHIVFKFSMTGYVNLVVTYATQGTGTGFLTQTWETSTDGITWSGAQAITSIPSSFGTKTLTTITALDNAAVAYLRLTTTGATGAAGNNRLDNIQFNASVAPPTLSATALTAFGSACTGSTIGPNSFTITGSALTTSNVTVGALSGFTYSTTSGGTYTSTLSLTQPGGAYSQQIFVKFSPSSAISYSGNIPVGGGGASSINVSASATGINIPVSVTTGGSSSITTTSAVVAGSLTAGCSAVTAYGIEYSLTNGFTPGTGTQVASSNLSAGNFTSSLTSLLPGTNYYYLAYATDGTGTVYGTQSSFLTTALVPTLSSGSLAAFGTVCTGSTAGPNSFTITGSNLTAANVNVGPLSGYTFSTASAGPYSSSLSLSQGGGAYSQQIYVDFSPTSAILYNGSIPVNGGGALLASNVSASGTGIAPPAQPSSISGSAAPCAGTTGLIYSVTNIASTTYTWSLPAGWVQTGGGTTNSITVTAGTATGTISVTPNNGVCDGPASTLAVNPIALPAQPSAISGSTSVCSGTTSLIYSVTNVGGVSYTWTLPSGWSQTAGGTSNSITVTAGTAGGTISVTPSTGGCPGSAQTLPVSVVQAPSITSATSSSPVCAGNPLTLTVNGTNFYTYQWNDPAGSTSAQIYQQDFNSLPSSGTSVTWTDNSTIPGWYASSINLATNGLVLGTGTNTAGDLYNFGSTSSTDRALGSLASSGTGTLTYGVKLTNNTGSAIDKVFVQYTGEQWRDGGAGAVPNTLTFTYSTNATSITTGTYTANTALNYVSTVNSNTGAGNALNGNANQTVVSSTISLGTPLASGSSIWLRWSDVNDAGSDMGIALDDLTVMLYNSSSTLLATPAAAASLSAFGASGTMTSSVYTATAATASGTYTVNVTNTAGCAASSTTSVTINPLPTPGITGTATACGSVTLTATGGSSYLWSGGSTPNTDVNTFTGSATYVVTVTSASGCSAVTSEPVTVYPNPTVVITNPAGVCPTMTADLTASAVTSGSTAGLTYSYWQDAAATIPYTTPSAATAGTYYIKGTVTATGCYDIEPVNVAALSTPSATASNTGPYITGQTISISSGPAGQTSYSWSGPGSYTATGQNQTRPTALISMAGTYTVTVTGTNGCTATATTNVVVNAPNGYTWTGATNTNWTTPTNWSPNSLAGGPSGCTISVIIPSTANQPVISSPVTIGNVTINNSAQLTLNSTLSTCGTVTGGTSSAANILGTGSLIMTGSSQIQNMSGIITLNSLTINEAPGVYKTGTLTINKVLTIAAGSFNNQSGTVTLVSNASGDAYLDNFSSPTAGVYIGNLTVQRYISNTADGYRDIASPVSTTVADLNNAYPVTGANGVDCYYSYVPYPNVQVYNEALHLVNGSYDEHWVSYTTLTNPLQAAKGVAFRTYVGAPYTISMTGVPYTGTQGAPITHTTTGTPSNDGFNLVGNPYPSPMKWSVAKTLNAGLTNGSYYVNHTTGAYTGNWGSYNGVTGVNGAGDNIAIGQGFFVQTPAYGIFTLNNTVRTGTSGAYYAPAPTALDNEIRLTLTNNVNSDEIVTYTDPQATAGFDPQLDAPKMPAGVPVYIGFHMPSPSKYYAINVMDQISDQTELPLTIYVTDNGTYTLNATTINTTGLTAYLKDAQSSTLIDLSTGPISLTLTGGQTYEGRYSVVFKTTGTATGISNVTEANTTKIFSFGDKVHVERSSNTPATISVTNVIGQEVKEIKTSTDKTVFELPTNEPWYAIIKVTEGSKVTVNKVLISNK